MTVELIRFARTDKELFPEYLQANQIAASLHEHLCSPVVLEMIMAANAPRASSALIQAVFLAHAQQAGFRNEAKGLFKNYASSALRPDYYMAIGESGILMEVERGKTTINNMDLLDFWKCHLCEHANFLFLMVPRELRQNDSMAPRREFNTVAKRMATFFVPHNYTNVWGLWLFGY